MRMRCELEGRKAESKGGHLWGANLGSMVVRFLGRGDEAGELPLELDVHQCHL